MKHLFTLLSLALSLTAMSQNYNWYTIKRDKQTGEVGIALYKAPQSTCGANEGCAWTSIEMMQQVHDYITCMGNKQSVLIDESSFEYDTYDYDGMGRASCWGYAHHSSVMLPAIVELKP